MYLKSVLLLRTAAAQNAIGSYGVRSRCHGRRTGGGEVAGRARAAARTDPLCGLCDLSGIALPYGFIYGYGYARARAHAL